MTKSLLDAVLALLNHYGDQSHGPVKAALIAELRYQAWLATPVPRPTEQNPFRSTDEQSRQG